MRVIEEKESKGTGRVGTLSHPGQAQGPLIRPTLPLVPTGRGKRGWLALVMVPLVALVVMVSGDLSRLALGAGHYQPARVAVSGAMVTLPLNSMQVSELSHLASFMQYKQLASMYVSHMTLDEKLGQLFMVQSYDQFY